MIDDADSRGYDVMVRVADVVFIRIALDIMVVQYIIND